MTLIRAPPGGTLDRVSGPILHTTPRANLDRTYWSVLFKGKRCTGCRSAKPVLRIQTFTAIADLKSDVVREAVTLLVKAGTYAAVPMSTSGKPKPGIRTGEVYACAACALEAERTAARAPSYVVVTFDRMPGSEGLIVPVGR